MKNLKLILSIAMFTLLTLASTAHAGDKSFNEKAAEYERDISSLQRELTMKEFEYAELVKESNLQETPDGVKSRGNASQCSYRCSLAHRNDHRMWTLCFSACTGR